MASRGGTPPPDGRPEQALHASGGAGADAHPPQHRAEDAFQAEVRAHLVRNALAHTAHGLLGQTGFRLIHAPTFVPAYVHLLSGSDVVVGLARGLQSFGMFLSPVLGATAIEHRRRVLPVGFAVGSAMRLQILGLALAGLWLPGDWRLLAALAFLGLFGFFLGMQGVIFSFLISKVIPVEVRGVLLGLRHALGGISAAAVGVIGGRLVDRGALGDGYAATFLLAFVLTALGLTMLLLVHEPESPAVRRPSRLRERLRDLPTLLRSDGDFTRYFVARALATMGRMAVPFYVLYAATRIELAGAELGLLTGGFVLAQSVCNLAWGLLADRRGFRLVFVSSLALWIGAALLLLRADGFPELVAVFTGLGAGLGGFQMSAQNLVLEFGARQNLPLRIAVANAGAELVGAVGPLVGGLLAWLLSYVAVFWTAIGFQLAALLLVMLVVPEPRHRARRSERRG